MNITINTKTPANELHLYQTVMEPRLIELFKILQVALTEHYQSEKRYILEIKTIFKYLRSDIEVKPYQKGYYEGEATYYAPEDCVVISEFYGSLGLDQCEDKIEDVIIHTSIDACGSIFFIDGNREMIGNINKFHSIEECIEDTIKEIKNLK